MYKIKNEIEAIFMAHLLVGIAPDQARKEKAQDVLVQLQNLDRLDAVLSKFFTPYGKRAFKVLIKRLSKIALQVIKESKGV